MDETIAEMNSNIPLAKHYVNAAFTEDGLKMRLYSWLEGGHDFFENIGQMKLWLDTYNSDSSRMSDDLCTLNRLIKELYSEALHRSADRARRELADGVMKTVPLITLAAIAEGNDTYKEGWNDAREDIISHLQSVGAVGPNEAKTDL